MTLPKRYRPEESEPRWQEYWAERSIFRYNPDSKRPVYSIDTPPPTVSGKIHMGHVFSYVQAEAMARYHRMRGMEVFYPFCFDDNGLPSERFTEREKNVRAQDMPRRQFVELCLEVTKEAEEMFRDLWTRFGFSCDWDLLYTTIDPWVQRLSQRSFLDLNRRGLVYRKKSPTLWCPECRTAVAQAETEDSEQASVFHDLEFPLADGTGTIPIATTRPELLPACVAVFVNPDDPRWRGLEGKKAVVPVFGHEVRILADPGVDMEKGSGVVMCCTFGDTTDIDWWQDYGLDLRIVLDSRGHMNGLAGFLEGMYWKKARKVLVDRLVEEGFRKGGRDISHAVNVHERCGTPLEYLVNEQWFVRILDRKEELLKRGSQVNWYPPHFKVRFDHWVENLKWDWCISRQRYYGVPFPVWYCTGCGEPIFAREEDLPVDPLEDSPSGQCQNCGGRSFAPESDVMDTWATSSLTPQINAKWGEDDEREGLLPMSLRPQAHDIIRTWAFYTITKAHLHSDDIPWNDIMVSGHALNPSGEKMSKSKGNVAGDPLLALEQYSADELRYWSCSSKLGSDVLFSEEVLGDGRRLVTKLWNAVKFGASRLEDYDEAAKPELRPYDRWILSSFTKAAGWATTGMDEYEYATAMNRTEHFFWKTLCDNYLEIVKSRLYSEDDTVGRRSAQYALYRVLYGCLRLFAPVLVHVTEELYQSIFRPLEGHESIHLAPWPSPEYIDHRALEYGDMSLRIIEEARKFKSESNLSMAAELERLEVTAPEADLQGLREMEDDLLSVTRAQSIIWLEGKDLSVKVFPPEV
ncbi:MAG: valine--tRNA ligase [Candidatus Fermentibacteraceae bacterium]|nr:valine--tRNA ligase [Candidatus Fermentibacteraceae bacterium]